MTGVIVLGSIAAYFAAGVRFGVMPFAQRYFADQLDRYPILYRRASQRRELRREALGWALPVALVWPAYVVWLRLADRVDVFIPETDVEQRERIAEQERRIADLERQLMGGAA